MNSFTPIESEKQYYSYCDELERVLLLGMKSKSDKEKIDLLFRLIKEFDASSSFANEKVDPIELLKSFMDDHSLTAKNIADLLQISEEKFSDILNGKKRLSGKSIKVLADRFKVRQRAFKHFTNPKRKQS